MPSRKIFTGTPTTQFIHLVESQELISARLSERSHEFMPIELLDSQFQTLEPLEQNERGNVIEISQSIKEIVDEITAWL